MIPGTVWLTKLVLSHLVTDFILQPKSWVEERNSKHFRSVKLYLHGFVTAAVAYVMMGWQYWPAALVLFITHTAIDGWKSYQQKNIKYFIADQLLHGLVIAACWYVTFVDWAGAKAIWQSVSQHKGFWKIITGAVFLTMPAGILIGQFTSQWRDKIENAESLANAGKWIGMAERLIIFIFVLQGQYSALGLLVAAKGIIRFNEKERPEIKTEYLVIGTLISIGIALVTGLLVKA